MALRRGILWCAVAFVAACSGDTGKTGSMGDPGADGMTGSDGPPGPITDPPALTALTPRWGSANSQIAITGTNFSTTAADNHVFFDGRAATVVSATATRLVVTPDVTVGKATDVVVNVEVANQVSNGLFFELVASGTSRGLDVPLPSAPTGVAVIGNDIYIASGLGGTARTGGLFKLSNGAVTQLIAGKLVTVQVGANSVDIMDVPLAIAAFNGNLYYTTTFGAVRKYTVATGVVTDVLSVASPGNAPFPQRTGITVDSAGTVYVIDRSGPAIIYVTANNTPGVLINGLLNDMYGIATDGTDLFVTNPTTFRVIKVAAPTTAPTYSIVATDTASGELKGVAVVGTNVIASDELGFMISTAKTNSGGTFSVFGDTAGYNNEATGLAVLGTDLIMAQPGGMAVRRKPAATIDATIVSTGVRYPLGSVEMGGKWYIATAGPNLIGAQNFSLDQKDCTITEIDPATGTTRVLATLYAPLGLVASGANQLTVTDSFDARIFTLDTTNGTQVDLLDSADFTGIPIGIARDATALYYIDTGGGRHIGKLVGTTQTASFVTGLDAQATSVNIAGGQLVTSSIFDPAPIQKAPVATGGAATVIANGINFQTGALQTATDGTLYALRNGAGQLITIDPATGTMAPMGAVVPPEDPLRASFAAGFAIGPDNTVVVMDYLGGKLFAIAP